MWLGWFTAAIGAFFFLMVAITAGKDNAGTLFGALGIGGGLILSGAMLYCLGAIVDHLAAIRQATEAQAKLFADRAAKPAS
jgi:hypothetical protein